ncbi:hypothetical protein CLAFUW4_06461 [Fulvia fulva]|uniref:Uncharacterized protein n=1 Tax=Passalora fulva TaxID=5499 RepID=A0A9Q8LIF7_PASFU|nr:uncharacterized protein CLAFUR5_06605 [Fulvia fulva]KAK4624000.1 hypothetical protein CLAFUR4_06465 [Fulvia fulva]KAK4625974.1 hypothetical protein CLAFUR0_06466 [Fulvia fulva]UJO17724.1 hypothetical protein CLAFUR5_06605 [Fulvia fulva]WPV14658.1 hypothetical protein CLAFUW4_06461 [Fulvia fulva]WPV30087.1 hypothetical protein CLAFUW7_06461 [Fulvia fulva]
MACTPDLEALCRAASAASQRTRQLSNTGFFTKDSKKRYIVGLLDLGHRGALSRVTKQDLASPKRAAGNIMGLDLVDVLLVSDPDVAVAKKSNAGAGAGAFSMLPVMCCKGKRATLPAADPWRSASCAARAAVAVASSEVSAKRYHKLGEDASLFL